MNHMQFRKALLQPERKRRSFAGASSNSAHQRKGFGCSIVIMFISMFSPCLITFSRRFMGGVSHLPGGTVVVSLKLYGDLPM
jgi:hypothetical protein